MFSNLIINAIDALPQDGELLLAIRPRNGNHGTIKGASVWIADRGVGIARENRPRLFEPFFTTKGEKGTGLGLWITHGIVQKQGAHSRPQFEQAGKIMYCIFGFRPLRIARERQ